MLARLCRNHKLVHGESGMQRMVGGNTLKRIGSHRARIRAVNENRINVMAVRSGDLDGNILAVSRYRAGRRDCAALPRRRRHRVFVDGKLRYNRVVLADISKCVGSRNLCLFSIYLQAANVPARFGSNYIGNIGAASYGGFTLRRNRAVLARLCRNHKLIHGESGMQCVAGSNMLKRIGGHRAHIHTVNEDRVDVIAVGCGDFDGDNTIVINRHRSRSDGTAATRRRRHRVLVDSELHGNRVIFTDIGERVCFGSIRLFPIYQQSANVPTRFRDDGISNIDAAGYSSFALRRNRAVLACLCRNHKLVHDESGMHRVAGSNMLKRIGSHRTCIHSINEDGINVMAVRSGDFDGNILAVSRYRAGRDDCAAIARRRRYRELVNSELDGNRMIFADIGERVGFRNLSLFSIHQQTADVPARFGDDYISNIGAAGHGSFALRRNRAVLARLCRNHKLVHSESSMHRVRFCHIIESIGRIRSHINVIREDGINVVAIICCNRYRFSSSVFHDRRGWGNVPAGPRCGSNFVMKTGEERFHRMVRSDRSKRI